MYMHTHVYVYAHTVTGEQKKGAMSPGRLCSITAIEHTAKATHIAVVLSSTDQ